MYPNEIKYINNIIPIMVIIMNIPNFKQPFPDKPYCTACQKEQMEQPGIVCKHCEGT